MRESKTYEGDKELYSMERMLDRMESMKDEIENRNQQVSSLQEQRSMISSENSKLRKKLQSQTEDIVSLKEKIAALSGSEMELRKARELSLSISEQEKLLKQREASLNIREAKLRQGEDSLKSQRDELYAMSGKLRSEKKKLEDKGRNFNNLIEMRAKDMSAFNCKAYEREYRYKETLLAGYVGIISVICLIIAVFTALDRSVFIRDVTEFGSGIVDIVRFIFGKIMCLATALSEYPLRMENVVMGNILHWIVLIVVWAMPVTAFLTGTSFLIRKFATSLIEKGISRWSISVMMIILILLIYLSDTIRTIMPVNLIVLWLITCTVTIAIHWYVHVCRENRGCYR